MTPQKKKRKSLVGWTWKDWRKSWNYNGGILDSFNAVYKENNHTPKTNLVKVRITIEELPTQLKERKER